LTLVGCATVKEAPISSTTTSVDTSKESIAFMTVKVSNQKNTSYQPNLNNVFVWEKKEKDVQKHSFKVIKPINTAPNQYNEYVVSFNVAPGEYVIRSLFGRSGIFPFIGNFLIPFYKQVSIPSNKVVYLGHVDATIVDRTSDNQLRAGPVIPLIDQAIVGASGGTFKIDIQDHFEADTAYIKEKFPAFKSINIENMLLSPWVQPSAKEMQ
jgi:hypothetical protein